MASPRPRLARLLAVLTPFLLLVPSAPPAAADVRGAAAVAAVAPASFTEPSPDAGTDVPWTPRFSRAFGGGYGDGGPATEAVTHPEGSALLRMPSGELLFQDAVTGHVRTIGTDGVIRHRYGSAARPVPPGWLDGLDARTTRLPSMEGGPWLTADGALLFARRDTLVRIDPVSHRMTQRQLPWTATTEMRAMFVRRDGRVVVAVTSTPGPVTTMAQLPPTWTAASTPTPLMATYATKFAESPDGDLYHALESGIYRHRTSGAPVLVAGIERHATPVYDPDTQDGPALGAGLEVDQLSVGAGGQIALIGGYTSQAVRVVSDGRLRTVVARGVPPLTDGGCRWARLTVVAGEALLPCSDRVVAAPLDGSRRQGPLRLLAGLPEPDALPLASPDGTPRSRAWVSTFTMSSDASTGELVLSTSRDVRRVSGSAASGTLDVIATLDEAVAGLGWSDAQRRDARWSAAVDRSGSVVATTCRLDTTWRCLLRRQTAGGWSTVVAAGDDASGWFVQGPTWALDAVRGRVLLAQAGPPVPGGLDATGVVRVVDLDSGTATDVPGLPGLPVALGVLPDGAVLVQAGWTEPALLLLDLPGGTWEPTGVRPTGQLSVAADGTVWTAGYDSIQRSRLDGTVVERADGLAQEAWGLASFDVPLALEVLAVPGGVMVRRSVRLATEAVELIETGPVAPAAPASLSATPGDGRVHVSWSAAAGYGRPITSYTVTASPGGHSTTVPGTALGATLTGLTNGTGYRLTVRATGPGGTGADSAPSSLVTPALAPPLRISATPASITAGQTSRVCVRTQPDEQVNLYAYTLPDRTYRLVRSGASASTLPCWDVRPGADTRLYAAPAAGPASRSSVSTVVTVSSAPPLRISATPARIKAGQTSRVCVRTQPGEQVNLYAYTLPDRTYRLVRSGASASTLPCWDVRPGADTRLYAAPAAGPASRSSASTVISVVP